MCGISGYYSRSVDVDLSKELNDSLNRQLYRGPDANNTWIDRNVGFAHARLSIIDLSEGGMQPMHSQDDRFHIVFNGEIYNYKEVKSELVKKGYSFRSNSDTEVILQSINQELETTSGDERKSNIKKQSEIKEWFKSSLDNLEAIFDEYIKLQH